MENAVRPAIVERLVARPIEPLDAIPNLITAWGRDDYVLYEDDDVWHVGFGIDAQVWMDAEGAHLRTPETSVDLPPSDRPAGQLGELLTRLDVPDRSAFGWVSFELDRPVGERTAHLVVPRTRVRLTPSGAQVRGPDPEVADRLAAALPRFAVAPVPGTVDVDLEAGGAEYAESVERALSAIRARVVDKVVLSRTVPVETELDLVATYVAGRRSSTPSRSVLLNLGGTELVAFCPETVVTVDGSGDIVSEPVAGTRSCPDDPREAARLARELQTDPKEVFEHAISVRAMIEDLRGTCDDDGAAADDLLSVQRRGAVQHLASRVRGRLRAGRTPWEAFAALFPAVTATGVPRRDAHALIGELESSPRGLYGGAAVHIGHDGSFDSALILRAIYRQDGRTWLRAGGGIVEGSRPERELEETREKLRGIVAALVPRDAAPTATNRAVS